MTTITLSPETETGSVTLDILKTADVTAVTRTNVNGTESVRVSAGQLPSASLAALVRTNLVTNPSFETGNTGYTASSGATMFALSNQTTGGLFGSRCARVTVTESILYSAVYGPRFTATLTGGKTYVVSFHHKASLPDYVYFWTPSVVVGGNALGGTAYYETNGAWSRTGWKFTVPGTGAQTASITFYAGFSEGTPLGATADFDGVVLEEATSMGTYFDGATADTAGFDYAWTGTAHASTSTLTTTGGRLILTDYEAAQGTNTYNVYTSDGSFITGSVELEIEKPWLMVPIAPNYSEQVETITNYSAGRETFSTVHQIIGRADPLVVMGKLGSRTGVLEFFAWNLDDVNRLTRVFDRGEAVLLKQTVPGMDMYFAATSMDVSPYSVEGPEDTRYKFSVNYQEVIRPFGDLAGALGWTFDELAAEYSSFNAVAAAFATFDDLTLGDNS